MSRKQYRPWKLDQQLLFPPALRDWLPEDHLVYRFIEAVGVLDIGAITSQIQAKDPRGNRPYHPRMMLALVVFAYATGVYSSRRIAGATYESVPFRVLTGDEHPHFTVINEFRTRHRAAVKDLFMQVLSLCARAGLVDLEQIALDGSKVQGNASKHKAMSYERMKRELERLEGEVEAMLDRADRVDAEEDERYGVGRDAHELADELKRREERMRRIRQAKEELEREAAQAREEMLRRRAKEQREKAAEEEDPVERKRKQSRARRAEQEAGELAERWSMEPSQPDGEHGASDLPEHKVPSTPSGDPQPSAQRNFTDPDSRIMKRAGAYLQGYNCQCAVDGKHQIIVAEGVTNQAPDQEHFRPLILRVQENLARLPQRVIADAGYMSEENVAFCEEKKVDSYISVSRDKHGKSGDAGETVGDALSPAWAAMQAKLRTIEGRLIYARRKAIAEPVFGQIKEARRFRRFSLRGLDKVRGEWTLVCLSHNFLKLFGLFHGRIADLVAQQGEGAAPAIS